MGAPTSDVHLVCEATEQPHLADDYDSDAEMLGPRTSEGLQNDKKDRVDDERELRKHLNVTLSEATHLTRGAKALVQRH